MPKNNNCDNDKCRADHGIVKVYPLGTEPLHSNLILCHTCWDHENQYNKERGEETKDPDNWPQLNWFTAKIYNMES